MAKKYSLAAIVVCFLFLFSACSKDKKAAKPLYLNVSEILVETDYASQGTSNSLITTAWVVLNGDILGAFELPLTIPMIVKEGANNLKVYPGINLNGVSSTRAIYDGYSTIDTVIYYTESAGDADTTQLLAGTRTTKYNQFFDINIIENFDGSGLNLEKTSRSDTNAQKTSDSTEIFINWQKPSENNGKAGVLYTTVKDNIAEVTTTGSLQLPIGGVNVYLELNYKCTIPFTIGVISEMPNGQNIQEPTVVISPKSEWNKIYINLVSEISGNTGVSGYKIFFYAKNVSGMATGEVYLDNIKLVY